jgi:predicted nucleic acid-binding protein
VSGQYLLDTNVLSESRRKEANAGVVAFLAETDPSLLTIGVLTLGALRKAFV